MDNERRIPEVERRKYTGDIEILDHQCDLPLPETLPVETTVHRTRYTCRVCTSVFELIPINTVTVDKGVVTSRAWKRTKTGVDVWRRITP